MTDDQLVERVKNGDSLAFEELVFRYQKPIYYFVLRMLKSPLDAEDAVQKIFLLAYKNIKGFRADSTFKTWLYRIGINQCNNFFRQNKNREFISVDEIPVADFSADQEGDLSEKEILVSLRKAVDRLPYKQRMVVSLRIYQDLSFDEIGKSLDIRANSAKVNFHHAMEKLKNWMKT
ncbi:MAG: RNA polymerase sigma factor [Deltaproteobacteria bacterium]|nr:RNA polymerase sigma factor [Deltaproteobacteria bacterium]